MREREGSSAKRWEGEGLKARGPAGDAPPHPSPLPQWGLPPWGRGSLFSGLLRRHRRRLKRWQRGTLGAVHRFGPPAILPFGEDILELRHDLFGEETGVVLRQILAHVAEL